MGGARGRTGDPYIRPEPASGALPLSLPALAWVKIEKDPDGMPLNAPKDGSAFFTYAPGEDGEYRFDVAGYDPEFEYWWKRGCGLQFATHFAIATPPVDI